MMDARPQRRPEDLLTEVFHRLFRRYGPQHWWPGEGPLEVIVGAILTQSAAWGNVEKALANLKRAGALSPRAIRQMPLEELASLVRPSGYYTVKARKLKAFMEHLARYGDDLGAMMAQDTTALREELLSIYGVGEETADDILLYVAQRPVFVIDAYTRRIVDRLGLAPPRRDYSGYQALFHQALPRDPGLFNEYHALLVRLGKEVCRREPRCPLCPLADLCATGRARLEGATPAPSPGGKGPAGRPARWSPPPAGRPTPGSRSGPGANR